MQRSRAPRRPQQWRRPVVAVAVLAAVALLSGAAGLPAGADAPTLPTADPVAAVAGPPHGRGLWTVSAAGAVVPRFGVPGVGSLTHVRFNAPIVGAAATPSGRGLWALGRDGGIFSLGDAQFFGSTGGLVLNRPVVGMAATPTGRGYWLVASDGGIFTFGDAQFFGSTGGLVLNRPVVGMAATPTGRGYWLVASDGGIFSFGDAQFFGSTGALRLNQPIIAMAATPTGQGYWLLAADGGIFAFGDAAFLGSLGATAGFAARGIVPVAGGYAVVGADGAVHRVTGEFLDPENPPPNGPFTFLNVGPDGRPVRWDPCRPVRYATNLELAPPFAARNLRRAIARVERATGLDLRFAGSLRGRTGLDGVPPPWADAVIAFSTPAQSGGLLDGFTLGVGGNGGVLTERGGRATIGFVLIDSTKRLTDGFAKLDGLGTLFQHELGHLVGLGHTPVFGQLMYPTLGSANDWQRGDRAGLWRLSSAQGCLPGPLVAAAATGIVALP
jgi:hypothetical protein